MKEYMSPEIELILFRTEVITDNDGASGGSGTGAGGTSDNDFVDDDFE